MALSAGDWGAYALKFGICGCYFASVGGDHGVHQAARQVHGRSRAPEAGDRAMPIEILADTEAQGVRAVPEQRVKLCHVIGDQGALVAHKRLGDFGNHLGNVDLEHQGFSESQEGVGDASTPSACAAAATRSTRSSRHGAATICMPSGK